LPDAGGRPRPRLEAHRRRVLTLEPDAILLPRTIGEETAVSLSDAWEREARAWIEWARAPGHDSYWRFHRDQFLDLVPPPGRLTLDLGCGEGRLSRDLQARPHPVAGIARSPVPT